MVIGNGLQVNDTNNVTLDTKKRKLKVKKAFRIFGLTIVGILVLAAIFSAGYFIIGKGFIVRGNTIVGYLGNAEELTIPEKIFGNEITGIGESAFDVSYQVYTFNLCIVKSQKAFDRYDKFHKKFIDPIFSNNIKSLTVPNTVTNIEIGAFGGMPCVETIHLPTNLRTINKGIMYGCPNLKEINIPDSVTEIGAIAFADCKNLKSLKIPDTAEVNYTSLFRSVDNIEHISYRNSSVDNEYVIFDGNILKYKGEIDKIFTVPNKVHNIKRVFPRTAKFSSVIYS